MLTTKEPRLLWAWVCPITGMVWDEAWAATEGYATHRTESTLGKRRMRYGEMRLVRVTIEPCSDEETAKYRAEFEEWRAKKESARPEQQT